MAQRQVVVWAIALVLFTACAREPRTPDLDIVFFDVGHGDAVLVREGRDALEIDAGLPNTRVASRLRRLGVDSLRVLIASHNHNDHIGSVPAVLESVAVGEYVDNGFRLDTPVEHAVLDAAERHHITATALTAPRTWTLGHTVVEVLPSPAVSDTEQNNRSLVVRIVRGSFRALLTGDSQRAETDALAALHVDGPVSLLKAPHHGDPDAISREWLARLRPAVVVASTDRHLQQALFEALYWTPAVCLARTNDLGDVTVTVGADGRPVLRGSRWRVPRKCPG
jgi:beta-lactamase superfamily II metal-dependent hydrolase